MKELIKINNSNVAGNGSCRTELSPCTPMTWQAGNGYRVTQHSIWQEVKTIYPKREDQKCNWWCQCLMLSSTAAHSFPSSFYYRHQNKYAWARHHSQNHGSLLSTLQAPNNWFLYPITLHKRKYCLVTTAEDPQTHPGEMHWECQWKVTTSPASPPAKILIFSFYQAPYFSQKTLLPVIECSG